MKLQDAEQCSGQLNVTAKVTEVEDARTEYSVAVPLCINFLLLVVSIMLLLLLSRWRRAKQVFLPKTYAEQKAKGIVETPLSWFREAYAVDEEKAISIDGRIVVRLCLLGIKFSLASTLCACVLCPIYGVAGGNHIQGSNKYSVSNLAHSNRAFVWVLVVGAYYNTAVFIWLMRAEWRYFVIMRQHHFVRRARGDFGPEAVQAACSLMIENVPSKYSHSKSVKSFFEKLFADKMHSTRLHRDTLQLYHLQALKAQVARVTGWSWCDCCRSGVDSITERIVSIETELIHRAREATGVMQNVALDGQLEVQDLAKLFAVTKAADGTPGSEADQEPGAQLRATSTAFVTLRRVSDRVLSEQVLLFSLEQQEKSDDWVVRPAPEARDVVWQNVGVAFPQVRNACKLGSLACGAAVLVWSVPVAAVQWLGSGEFLRTRLPKQTKWLMEHSPATWGLLTSYLPVLALMVLILLLPYALRILAETFEMRKTKTDIARSVMWRNFCFQFFSLWLTVFSNSLMESFREILERPACVTSILGFSIPQVSFYFLSFVVARIGTSLPLLLLRVSAILPLLSRQKPAPAYCAFETEVTNIAIVFVLGGMYCVVAPVMMPACLIYFCMAYLVYKWLFVHVYEDEFDLGGEMWYPVFDGLVGGMLFGILSVCGLAPIYAGTDTRCIYAMWLLPFILVYFAIDCHRKFGDMSRVMPFTDAVQLDSGAGLDAVQFQDDLYVDPILKVGASARDTDSLSATSDEPEALLEEDSSSDSDCGVQDLEAVEARELNRTKSAHLVAATAAE